MSTTGDEASRRTRYVDLTLGAWRPREAAFQLAAGLGLTLPQPGMADRGASAMAAGLAAVYTEATGDPVIMTAYHDAAMIGPALPGGGTVAVLGPRWNLPLRVENEWFFLFLRRHGLSIALVGDDIVATVGKSLFERRRNILAPETTTTPSALSEEQRRLLRFFPGLLPRSLVERTQLNAGKAGLLLHGSSHFLVPVTWRDRDPRVAPRDFDALGDIEKLDDGLLAIVQSFCTNYFADSGALAALAQRVLLAGGIGLARDLADRARAVARQPDDAALAELRRQETRLSERRFAEMVAAPEPSRHASAAVKEELRRLRSLGAVMAGNLGPAERDIAVLQARLKDQEPLYGEDLHFLNMVADARLSMGDAGGAFLIAEAIDAALRRDTLPDPRLVFENALTLARIHRLRGDVDDQRAALARAFATTEGARTLAEVIEMNVLRAAAGREPQAPETQLCWLRAALAWLAVDPTEGLAHRTVVAVLGREVARAQLDLEISEALGTALAAAWPKLDERGPGHPVFRGLSGGAGSSRMFAAPGVGVLWMADSEPARIGLRPRLKLIGLVTAALRQAMPRLAGVQAGTVLVDTNLGKDIPATRGEALSVALRGGAGEFAFLDETVMLDEQLRPALAADLHLSLSPAVAKIESEDGRQVATFRRPAVKRTLSDAEATAVGAVRGGTGLPLSAVAELLHKPLADAETILRALEAAQVVRLDVAPP